MELVCEMKYVNHNGVEKRQAIDLPNLCKHIEWLVNINKLAYTVVTLQTDYVKIWSCNCGLSIVPQRELEHRIEKGFGYDVRIHRENLGYSFESWTEIRLPK